MQRYICMALKMAGRAERFVLSHDRLTARKKEHERIRKANANMITRLVRIFTGWVKDTKEPENIGAKGNVNAPTVEDLSPALIIATLRTRLSLSGVILTSTNSRVTLSRAVLIIVWLIAIVPWDTYPLLKPH